jgi:hypothetical protein
VDFSCGDLLPRRACGGLGVFHSRYPSARLGISALPLFILLPVNFLRNHRNVLQQRVKKQASALMLI